MSFIWKGHSRHDEVTKGFWFGSYTYQLVYTIYTQYSEKIANLRADQYWKFLDWLLLTILSVYVDAVIIIFPVDMRTEKGGH